MDSIYHRHQSYKKKSVVGRKYNSIKKDPIVYKKNGTVYHTDLHCSYLELSITEINYSDLHETRNKWGQNTIHVKIVESIIKQIKCLLHRKEDSII